MGGVIIFVVVAAIFLIFVAASRYYDKKRSEELQAFASSMGLSFSEKRNKSFDLSLSNFHIFTQGYSRRASKIINGPYGGADIKIFDYRYTTGSGKSRTRHNQTIVQFKSDRLRLPSFELRPENFFHKIAGSFGYQDIDFEMNPKFSKQYLLRSDQDQACRELFSFNRLHYFEENKGLSVEGKQDILIFYHPNRTEKPSDLKTFLDQGVQIYNLFS